MVKRSSSQGNCSTARTQHLYEWGFDAPTIELAAARSEQFDRVEKRFRTYLISREMHLKGRQYAPLALLVILRVSSTHQFMGLEANLGLEEKPMTFRHVRINGNPPLVGSYCLACLRLIATSTKEQLLAILEELHRCTRQGSQVASTNASLRAKNRKPAR